MEVRQLPRGRHRLTREEVTASQRGRMLQAMAAAVAEKGYTRMAVADVVAGAGVSPGGPRRPPPPHGRPRRRGRRPCLALDLLPALCRQGGLLPGRVRPRR